MAELKNTYVNGSLSAHKIYEAGKALENKYGASLAFSSNKIQLKDATGTVISEATLPAGAYSATTTNSVTAPSVAITTAATGFTASSSATSYYVTVTGTPTNGSVTSTATAKIDTAGYLATGSKTSGTDTDAITPTVTGSGTKVYIPAGSASQPTATQTGASASLSGTTLTLSKSVTPTVTAGYIKSGTAGTVKLSGTVPTETKSATPSTSSQTISPSSGKLLSSVTVNAISTETKTASGSGDITPSSGKYLTKVTVPAASTYSLAITDAGATTVSVGSENTSGSGTGYYPLTASLTGTLTASTAGWFSNGSATDSAVVGRIAKGSITNNTSGGTSTATITAGKQIKINAGYYPSALYYTAASNPTLSGNAAAANVLSGKTFYSNSYTKQTGTMATVTPAFDGGTLSQSGNSGGGLTATGTSVTLSDTNNGISVKVDRAAFSNTVTRGAVLYNGAKTGYLNVADNAEALPADTTGTTVSLAAGSITKYISAITVPASKTFSSFAMAAGSSSARTYLSSLSVPGYTTISDMSLNGIVESCYGSGYLYIVSGKSLEKIQNTGTINNYTSTGGITTYSNTGTITKMTGSRTITTLGSSSAAGGLTITNNGYSSSYKGTVTITTNTNGTVNVWNTGGDKGVQVAGHTVKVDSTTVTNSSGDLITATPAFDGGGLSLGTASGGGLTASGANVTLSDSNNGISITTSRAAFSQKVTRAAVLYNGAVNGWVTVADNATARPADTTGVTASLAAGSVTKYISGITVPSGKSLSTVVNNGTITNYSGVGEITNLADGTEIIIKTLNNSIIKFGSSSSNIYRFIENDPDDAYHIMQGFMFTNY